MKKVLSGFIMALILVVPVDSWAIGTQPGEKVLSAKMNEMCGFVKKY